MHRLCMRLTCIRGRVRRWGPGARGALEVSGPRWMLTAPERRGGRRERPQRAGPPHPEEELPAASRRHLCGPAAQAPVGAKAHTVGGCGRVRAGAGRVRAGAGRCGPGAGPQRLRCTSCPESHTERRAGTGPASWTSSRLCPQAPGRPGALRCSPTAHLWFSEGRHN